jgi:hypothetical protein
LGVKGGGNPEYLSDNALGGLDNAMANVGYINCLSLKACSPTSATSIAELVFGGPGKNFRTSRE